MDPLALVWDSFRRPAQLWVSLEDWRSGGGGGLEHLAFQHLPALNLLPPPSPSWGPRASSQVSLLDANLPQSWVPKTPQMVWPWRLVLSPAQWFGITEGLSWLTVLLPFHTGPGEVKRQLKHLASYTPSVDSEMSTEVWRKEGEEMREPKDPKCGRVGQVENLRRTLQEHVGLRPTCGRSGSQSGHTREARFLYKKKAGTH